MRLAPEETGDAARGRQIFRTRRHLAYQVPGWCEPPRTGRLGGKTSYAQQTTDRLIADADVVSHRGAATRDFSLPVLLSSQYLYFSARPRRPQIQRRPGSAPTGGEPSRDEIGGFSARHGISAAGGIHSARCRWPPPSSACGRRGQRPPGSGDSVRPGPPASRSSGGPAALPTVSLPH